MHYLQRFSRFVDRRMALISPLCMVTGILLGDAISPLQSAVVPMFAFMTFSSSLGLTFGDLRNCLCHPKALLGISSTMFLTMPLFARLLGGIFFTDAPAITAGLVLEAAVPSGVVSLMWTASYHGSTPLTLSSLLVNTLLSPFVIPLILQLMLGATISMDTASMMKSLLLMIALPALAGVLCNQTSGGKAKERLMPRLTPFSKIVLILVMTTNASRISPQLRAFGLSTLFLVPLVLFMVLAGFFAAYGLGKILRLKAEERVSAIYCIGIRNISAGAVIASAYFPRETLLPILLAVLFQQITAALVTNLLIVPRKHSRDSEAKHMITKG